MRPQSAGTATAIVPAVATIDIMRKKNWQCHDILIRCTDFWIMFTFSVAPKILIRYSTHDTFFHWLMDNASCKCTIDCIQPSLSFEINSINNNNNNNKNDICKLSVMWVCRLLKHFRFADVTERHTRNTIGTEQIKHGCALSVSTRRCNFQEYWNKRCK